jgi:hypothetical protein
MTQAPVLTWSVTGAARVHVSGPNLDSTKASGSQGVCPGNEANGSCVTTPGPYTYTIDAFDANNKRFAHRTVALTMT